MPQFNQINNNASFDQSLMSQSYIDGLGAVAERRSKERERQAKMINAVKLAMDRLGVVGNKAYVNEDGVIDARFNTFDGRKKYGEETNFGYTADKVGKNTTASLVDNGGNAALANIAAMNAQQPIGSTNGILPLFNSVTQTGGGAGSIIQLGKQGMQQVLQQPTPQPPVTQQQAPGAQQTTNAITGLLKAHQSAVGKTANLTASYGAQSGLNMQSQLGTLTTTEQGSKVTDASSDLSVSALESSAILEQAILGGGGPIAEALKNKYETIKSADKARSSDGVTQSLTAGNYSVGSTVSVNGSVGVGQSVNINNSSNLSGPTNTPTGSKSDIFIESGLDNTGNAPHKIARKAVFDSNNTIENPENFQNVVSTGGYGANIAKTTTVSNNRPEALRQFEGRFSAMALAYPDGTELNIAGKKLKKSGSNFHNELKQAMKSAMSRVLDGKQGAAEVMRFPDGTILSFGRQNNGSSTEDSFGVMFEKIGADWLKESKFRTAVQTFLGAQ
jgi:hypothetical protein